MKEIEIKVMIRAWQWEELSDSDKEILLAAKEASRNSYAPYSCFSVGAALLLANGKIIYGSNQENAAYPSGLCAERTALYYANSAYPNQPVCILAIAANKKGSFTTEPIPPCGACRQALIETETRYKHPIRVLLYSTTHIYEINSIASLLPLSFKDTTLTL